MGVEFKVQAGDVTLVSFVIPSGVLNPEELPEVLANAPYVDATKGVIISGRGPIWLFVALAHFYHYCVWVATHDPRLGGAVVVVSHVSRVKVGEVIGLPKA